MRRATWLVLVIAVAACSQPERRTRRPDRVFNGPLGDREHAVEMRIDEDLGEARATAPRAGAWWYRVHFSPQPGSTSQITITANDVDRAQSARDRVRVDVFDGAKELLGVAAPNHASTVPLDERPEPITPLFVRVTTTGKARFYLSAFRVSKEIPEPPRPPRCDRHNMDPSNPNCAGVTPHCNLEDPDFTNPDCCQADCQLGALRCRAKVISAGPTAVNIAIGTSKHIMRFATGRLYQRGRPVSDILVLMVKGDESFVKIMSPDRVDAATLVENGEVILSQPEACQRR